jgi:hypothetical protein
MRGVDSRVRPSAAAILVPIPCLTPVLHSHHRQAALVKVFEEVANIKKIIFDSWQIRDFDEVISAPSQANIWLGFFH